MHTHPEADDAPLVNLKGVGKTYSLASGAVHALRGIDLAIAAGEFVAIVGASGSGKSTLMNVLGCLDEPTAGSCMLAGVETAHLSSGDRAVVRNRLIGFVFQGFNLIPTCTALENCELPLHYRPFEPDQREKAARQALEDVGLGHRLHHHPNELSGGQQQRVAIARALVTHPPLLLADEPTGNLDTRASYGVLALLQLLNKTQGVTVVLVTHEPDVAACASRVVTMRDGRIVDDVRTTARSARAEFAALASDDAASVEVRAQPGSPTGAGADRSIVAFMALGAAAGAGLGAAYCMLAIGRWLPWLVVAAMLVGDCFLGATMARRRLSRPLDSEERASLAFAATVAFAALSLPLVLLSHPSDYLPREASAGLHRARAALPFIYAALAVSVTWSSHYILLGLLSPEEADESD